MLTTQLVLGLLHEGEAGLDAPEPHLVDEVIGEIGCRDPSAATGHSGDHGPVLVLHDALTDGWMLKPTLPLPSRL